MILNLRPIGDSIFVHPSEIDELMKSIEHLDSHDNQGDPSAKKTAKPFDSSPFRVISGDQTFDSMERGHLNSRKGSIVDKRNKIALLRTGVQ